MEETRPRTFVLVISIGLLFLILPLLYVLSAGPAAWMAERNYISGVTWNNAYDPLRTVASSSPAAKTVYLWYIRLWISNRPPPSPAGS